MSGNKAAFGFVALALLLFVLPFNHVAGLRNTLLVAGFAISLWQWRQLNVPSLPIKWSLLVWCAFVLASVVWSSDPAFSLREVKLELLLGLMVFALAYSQSVTEHRTRLLLRAVALAVIVTALLAFYSIVIVGVPSYHWDEVNDPWGWQQGFVTYSTYLVLAFPLLLGLLWQAGKIDRILLAVALTCALWAGWATQNRMVWVSLAVVAMVGGGLWYIQAFSRLRWRFAPLMLFAGVLAALLGVFALVTENRPANALAPVAASGLQSATQTLEHSERFVIWHYWLSRVPEHLWLGVGWGRDLPHMVYPKPPEWPVLFFAHAHNVFIDVLLQLGVIGLTLFIVLLASVALRFWQYYRSKDAQLVWLGVTGLMVLTAFASKNFTDDMFWRTDALFFWAMLGMLLGLGERTLQKKGYA